MAERQSTLALKNFCPSLTIIRGYEKLLRDQQKKKLLQKYWPVKRYINRWIISEQIMIKERKLQLKRMCGRKDQYFLISHIGNFCLWDTALMSCILKIMYVIVLLPRYSIYLVRLRIESKLEKIWLKWVYVSSWHQSRKDKIHIYRQHAILFRKEKIDLCKCLSEIKVPSGYSSNIQNLVSMKDLKLVGLKSHDCHALMQQFLHVAIRSVLSQHVRHVITWLCFFSMQYVVVGPRGYTLQLFCVLMMTNQIRAIWY